MKKDFMLSEYAVALCNNKCDMLLEAGMAMKYLLSVVEGDVLSMVKREVRFLLKIRTKDPLEDKLPYNIIRKKMVSKRRPRRRE